MTRAATPAPTPLTKDVAGLAPDAPAVHCWRNAAVASTVKSPVSISERRILLLPKNG